MDEDRQIIQEKHYKPGSTIELHCVVTNYLPEFSGVTWRHGHNIVTENSDRGGIRYIQIQDMTVQNIR